MTIYVAMLRGINVSGRNRLSMSDLRAIVADCGGDDVQTYIQSGNAVFRSGGPASDIAGDLEAALSRAVGNTIPVLVRTKAELGSVARKNPFAARGEEVSTLHVTFLGGKPSGAVVKAVEGKQADADEFRVIGREVYLHCPNGYGNTKLTNAFFEKKLGSAATTRNWKTTLTLLDMAGG